MSPREQMLNELYIPADVSNLSNVAPEGSAMISIWSQCTPPLLPSSISAAPQLDMSRRSKRIMGVQKRLKESPRNTDVVASPASTSKRERRAVAPRSESKEDDQTGSLDNDASLLAGYRPTEPKSKKKKTRPTFRDRERPSYERFVALSRVNRALRQSLLSSPWFPVWKTARESLKLPILSGMSEVRFANFLWTQICQSCYKYKPTSDSNFALRAKLCAPCRKNQMIHKDLVETEMNLHPQVLNCVVLSNEIQSFDDRYPEEAKDFWCLISDLEREDERLQQLEELDGRVKFSSENNTILKLKEGTWNQRNPSVPVTLSPGVEVASYVEQRKKEIDQSLEEAEALRKALVALFAREDMLEIERLQDQRENALRQILTRAKQDLLGAGWTEEGVWKAAKTFKSDCLPCYRICWWEKNHSLTESHYMSIRPVVMKHFKAKRDQQIIEDKREALTARIRLLRPFFEVFQATSGRRVASMLTFEDFYTLKCLEPFWIREGRPLTEKAIFDITPKLWSEILQWLSARKMEATVAVLTSHGMKPREAREESRSNSSAYNSSFFSRVTSLSHEYEVSELDQKNPQFAFAEYHRGGAIVADWRTTYHRAMRYLHSRPPNDSNVWVSLTLVITPNT
ncbi:hypothetical protein T439DRAFT_383070 [Meredithblackwellia eburnea MCA 4105]